MIEEIILYISIYRIEISRVTKIDPKWVKERRKMTGWQGRLEENGEANVDL